MGEADKRGKEEMKKEDVEQEEEGCKEQTNTVNNADTERDRATPAQDIDIYVCMYIYIYIDR